MVVATNEINETKHARKMTMILMAVPPGQYGVMCIAQWSTSRTSKEATGCRHQASAHIALPRRPPWSTNLVKNTKH
jgi:hypothetical protein